MSDSQTEKFLSHFPNNISEDIKKYINDVALLKSRYLFIKRKGKQQYAYCTHCDKWSKTEALKHNTEASCGKCSSNCVVKSDGRGRKYLYDNAYIVYYEKSQINKGAIVARGFYVSRNYSGNYMNLETEISTAALYVFSPGNGDFYESYFWNEGHQIKQKNVYSFFDTRYANIPNFCSKKSIEKAVKGTLFQYSTWEEYGKHSDMVRFFDLAARYPCVEYLTKIGLQEAVKAKLHGDKTYSAINWRGTQIEKVLRLPKQEAKKIVQFEGEISLLALKIFQISLKESEALTLEESISVGNAFKYSFDVLKELLKKASLKKIITYVKEQSLLKRDFSSIDGIARDWRDYIKACEKLGLDLNRKRILMPRNLHEAHQNAIKKINYIADSKNRKAFLKRAKFLKKYEFKTTNFFVRPVRTPEELVEEGKKLIHCVGDYADRVVNGTTNIMFVRKTNEPDEPFYTMELKHGQIFQCRGYGNEDPTAEVQTFIELFKKNKLSKKGKGIAV